MTVWINEFHYDNAGADTGEFIELAGDAGSDLTGWTLVLYNGNGGGAYRTIDLIGTIAEESDGLGTVVINTPGLQNGSPDGFALVDDSGGVIEFLSYEGSFVAADGPAAGMTSIDVGVFEPNSTETGFSLQRQGDGPDSPLFSFAAPQAETRGSLNNGGDVIPPAPSGGDALFTGTVGRIELDGAEIVEFDPQTGRAFVTSGNGLQVVDMSDPANPMLVGVLTSPEGGRPTAFTSVALANGLIAASLPADDRTEDGWIVFFDAETLEYRGEVQVGPNPDHVVFNEDGTRLLVANEGESAGEENEPFELPNPEGSISIVKINDKKPSNSPVKTLDFNHPSITFDSLEAAGVRVNRSASSAAADLEPEYITIQGSTAYVTLQENNAVVVIEDIFDPSRLQIDDFIAMGTQDHSAPGNEFDASNRDNAINIVNWDVNGLYMPDQIASYVVDGVTYFVTANEGDGRDVDESRGADLVDGDLSNGEVDRADVGEDFWAQLGDDAQLGRLKFSNIDGDTDGDGLIEELHSFGGRSFSIYNAETGERVFDSGNQFEAINATLVPEIFNSDDSDPDEFDDRSDDKGPEPESVVLGEVDGQLYAFIALERTGGIMVYNVSDPADATFERYITVEEDISPEGLRFVDADDSPTGQPLLLIANEGSDSLSIVSLLPEEVAIYDIQGAQHRSPYEGEVVRTAGIITAIDSNGFYLQDAAGDGDIATSDAIFVFTGFGGTSGLAVADEVRLDGTVSEFFPGGAASGNLSTTQISNTFNLTVLSSGNPLPEATNIGAGGRLPPTENIDDDAFGEFDAANDGIDFFESLESMLVTATDLVAVSGTNRFGEIFAVTDGATGISERGTLNISPDDFNPEKIQIDEDSGIFNFDFPSVDVGDHLGDVTGVIGYSFGNFEILPTVDFTPQIVALDLEPETGDVAMGDGILTVASYNVLNLDPNDSDGDTDIADGRFDAIAQQIAGSLGSPDIIALQEVQDSSGSWDNGVIDPSLTLEILVERIEFYSGISYEFVINEFITDGASGGQPGGNIQTAFLYNSETVSLIEDTVQTIGGQGEGEAFFDARLPLVASFEYGDQEVTLVDVHLSSKGGSAPILGVEQDFAARQEDVTVNGSLDERQRQAEAIAEFVEGELAADPDANLIVLGDFNEFEFVSPVTSLEDAGLENLTLTVPEDERYSFIFQGNSQSLDHMLVSGGLADVVEFDIVHVNSEFAETTERASDHDPLLASFDLGDQFLFV